MSIPRTILATVLFAVVTGLVYVPVFHGGYYFDDRPLLENNPYVKDIKNIPVFFVSKEARVPWTHGDLQDDIYRPVQSASFAISYALWGNNPGAFHRENVFLHFVNGVLIYLILSSLLNSAQVAFLAALLFLVHPVQVEAVAYLVERASVLSLTLFLAAFGLFVHSGNRRGRFNRYTMLSLGSFAIALFTKEIAIILPAVLVLYVICFRDGEDRKARTIVMSLIPYVAIALVYVVARTVNLGRVGQYETIAMWRRLLIMSEVFWDYLKLMVFPARLTFFPAINSTNFAWKAEYAFYVATVVGFVAGCVVLYRKNRRAAFFPLTYLVALLPVSNIIPIKTYMQERFLYYPSVFMLAFAAMLMVAAVRRASGEGHVRGKYAFAVLVTALVVPLTVRAHMRSQDWKDPATLMLKEASVNPDNGRAYFDLAVTRFKNGDYVQSRTYAERALRVTRDNVFLVEIYDLLGNLDKIAKDYDHALENYRAAIKCDPGYPYPYNSVGMIYAARGNVREAIPFFEQAVSRDPNDPIFNKNLGTAYGLTGNREQAVHYWTKSLELNPDQPALREKLDGAQGGPN